jgi:hypothetical protein
MAQSAENLLDGGAVMMQRIIASQPNSTSDASLKEVTEIVSNAIPTPAAVEGMSDTRLKAVSDLVTAKIRAAVDVQGDQPVDLSLLFGAAKAASVLTENRKRDAVMQYLSTLREPHRSIFIHRTAGVSSRQIATRTKLPLKTVCRLLAKMHVDLSLVINLQETSV